MNFLIVDSNKARFSEMQKMLKQSKLDPTSSALHAMDLAQAFKVYEGNDIEFIFMNCRGSRNPVAQIRQLRTMTGKTPIVALLAGKQEQQSEEFIKAGADDSISHSELTPHLLARMVRYVVKFRMMDQAKTDFLANVSHEMRTSLHWILGTVDLLNETGLNPQQKKLVQTFSLSGQRLLMLLSNVLGLKWSEFADHPLPEEVSPAQSEKKDLEILVVDDDFENQRLIAAFTEKTRHRITYVKDGYEALNVSKNRCFDLILMDIEMPGLNGFETVRMMKSLRSCQKSKILGLSANAFPGDIINAKKIGFSGYMTKPINRQRLLSSITGCFHSEKFYEAVRQ